ncbi:MAG: glycosyltransferase family A protein [Actinomycetota bacterium]
MVATRDRPQLLRRAIDAIVAQDFDHDIEVIVVFDRSEPDHGLEFESSRRRVVVTTNARTPGLPGARNSGIDKAGHDWVAFCDDDDEWLPGKLSGQFAAIDRDPACRAACTGIYIRYEGDDTARIPDASRLTFEGFVHDRMTEVHPSSWLIEREWLTGEVGLVDEEIPGGYAEDYDLMLRTARLGPIAVAPEPLVRVWWHGSSFFFERWKMIDDALAYLLAKHPEFAADPAGWAQGERCGA